MSRVRVLSSAGRALRWQRRGRRFDPDRIHQPTILYTLTKPYKPPKIRCLKPFYTLIDYYITAYHISNYGDNFRDNRYNCVIPIKKLSPLLEQRQMAKATTQLTDKEIRAAKPKAKEYKLFDGGGLYLSVTPKGKKWWRLKYRFEGKEKRISLGVYPTVTLKAARLQREELITPPKN